MQLQMLATLTTKLRQSASNVVKKLSRGSCLGWLGYKFSLLSLQAKAFSPAASEEVTGYVKKYGKAIYHINTTLSKPTLRILTCSSTLQCTRKEHDRITIQKGNKRTLMFRYSTTCKAQFSIQSIIYSPKTRHTRLRLSMVASLLVELQ